MNTIKKVNIGCGKRYDKSWINIDFSSSSPDIIQYDLNKGIPFDNNSVDVVYSSHVLEHFSNQQADFLLSECYRVLKKDGIVRVVVPDLESICKEYLQQLEIAVTNNANPNYEWIVLELFDQMVRHTSGGEMKAFILNKNEDLLAYINSRMGQEAVQIRDNAKSKVISKTKNRFKNVFIPTKWYDLFLKMVLTKKYKNYLEIGKFRQNGEIHQWMYDRYSLKKMLESHGFFNVASKTASDSLISDWKKYNLDSDNHGNAHKPDSLFMEAQK
jgi:predicted SAM-dependent methyltransferase